MYSEINESKVKPILVTVRYLVYVPILHLIKIVIYCIYYET
jgi:hypothetical protein